MRHKYDLTDKQRRVLLHHADMDNWTHHPPTVRQIAEWEGDKHFQGISRVVHSLQRRGFLDEHRKPTALALEVTNAVEQGKHTTERSTDG